MMRVLLLTLMLLLLPTQQTFAKPCISWVWPTQREDLTPLPRSEIKGVLIYWERVGTDGKMARGISSLKVNPRFCYSFSVRGEYKFWAVTVDTNDIESKPTPKVPWSFL